MFIQVSRVKNAITGSYNGVPFGVSYTEERYKEMKELEKQAALVKTPEELNDVLEKFKPLTQETFKELAESKCPYLFVNPRSGKFYLKLRGRVLKNPMPQALADRIIKSVEEGIEFLPLIKSWIRFLRLEEFKKHPHHIERKGQLFANYLNRTFVDQSEVQKSMKEGGLSHEKAIELHTRLQTPITEEGLLVTYKVVKEMEHKFVLVDGEKKKVKRWEAQNVDPDTGIVTYKTPKFLEERVFYPAIMGLDGGHSFNCTDPADGTTVDAHIIKVGYFIELDSWDKVNTNDGTFGAMGLHGGNLDYIKGYQTADTVTLNVFIDPMHIGRFTDQGDGAIIAKKMFIYGAFGGVNKGIYHSSDYAKLNDAEYEDMLKKSLEDFGEYTEDIKDRADDASAIADSNTLDSYSS